MASHEKPKGRQCSHHRYRLKCEDYDELVNHAGNQCQICGRSGPETAHGFLVIDHDYARGYWAVRGLLCSRCNTLLGHGTRGLKKDAAERYLANPWYQQMLAARGLTPDLPDEPPIGTAVRLPGGVVARRGEDRWSRERGGGRYVRCSSWAEMHRAYGPHNVLIAAAA